MVMVGGGEAAGAVVGGGEAAGTVPAPTTARDTLSPFAAAKVRFALDVAATVGLKRTVTGPVPRGGSVKGLPERTLKAAGDVETAPATVVPVPFCTVNVRSTNWPTITLPKSTVPVGLTEPSLRATALCAGVRQGLSLPAEA